MNRWLLVASAFVAAGIPVGFVATTPAFTTTAWIAVAVGTFIALQFVLQVRSGAPLVVATLAFAICAAGLLLGAGPAALAALWAPFVIGVGVSLIVRNWLVVFLVISLISTLSLGIEWLADAHVFSEFFGEPFQIRSNEDIFRARGIIGQPIPAAMIAVNLAAMSLLAPIGSLSTRACAAIRVTLLALAIATLFLTGTRGAIIVLVVGLLLALVARARARSVVRISPFIVVAGCGVIVVLVVSGSWLIDAVSGNRLFDFSSLESSVSYGNRALVADVFEVWQAECAEACLLIGDGWPSLQQYLAASASGFGLSTVDNLYMSLLWDFGPFAPLGMVLLALRAFFVIARPTLFDESMTMGAVGLIMILASGALYDALYIRPIMILFGLCVGLVLATNSALLSRGSRINDLESVG